MGLPVASDQIGNGHQHKNGIPDSKQNSRGPHFNTIGSAASRNDDKTLE